MPAANAWSQGRVGPGARFLDPKTLQRIGSLELVARGVVEGFLQGLHRSPFLGQSMDFAAYRPYVVGDDPRRTDWKVFARTERYYVKEYEAETNTNFTVLLDCSHSMAFGEAEVTKFDYARYLAACLSFLARKQGDRRRRDLPAEQGRPSHRTGNLFWISSCGSAARDTGGLRPAGRISVRQEPQAPSNRPVSRSLQRLWRVTRHGDRCPDPRNPMNRNSVRC